MNDKQVIVLELDSRHNKGELPSALGSTAEGVRVLPSGGGGQAVPYRTSPGTAKTKHEKPHVSANRKQYNGGDKGSSGEHAHFIP